MERKNSTRRIFAVMLSFVLLIGVTACGNNRGQSESGQDTIGRMEGNSGKDSMEDSVSEPVAKELESGVEAEVPENTTDVVGMAGMEEDIDSNILIAYFSRVGNMDFDEDIDAVTSASVNMDAYDTVILIYPNWWGTLPQPVFTFLEEYDFSGKTILPICTHEGSRLGRSDSDIASVCPDAQLLEGLSVRGSDVGDAQTEVEEWISSSGILE